VVSTFVDGSMFFVVRYNSGGGGAHISFFVSSTTQHCLNSACADAQFDSPNLATSSSDQFLTIYSGGLSGGIKSLDAGQIYYISVTVTGTMELVRNSNIFPPFLFFGYFSDVFGLNGDIPR